MMYNSISDTISGRIICVTGLNKIFERAQQHPDNICFSLRMVRNKKCRGRTKWIRSDLQTFLLRFEVNVADCEVHRDDIEWKFRIRLYGKNKSWRASKIYGEGFVGLNEVLSTTDEVDVTAVVSPVLSRKNLHLSRFVSRTSRALDQLHKLI